MVWFLGLPIAIHLATLRAGFEIQEHIDSLLQKGGFEEAKHYVLSLPRNTVRKASVNGPVYPIAYVPDAKAGRVRNMLWRRGVGCATWMVLGLPMEVDILNPSKVSQARDLLFRAARKHGYLQFVLDHPMKS